MREKRRGLLWLAKTPVFPACLEAITEVYFAQFEHDVGFSPCLIPLPNAFWSWHFLFAQ